MKLFSQLLSEIRTGARAFWWVPKHTPDLKEQLTRCELLDDFHRTNQKGSFRDYYGKHFPIETYRKLDISRYLGLITNHTSYDDCRVTKKYRDIMKHHNGNIDLIVKHPELTDHLFEQLSVKGLNQPYQNPYNIVFNYIENSPSQYVTRAEFMLVVCSTWTEQQYIDGLKIIQYIRSNNVRLEALPEYASTSEIRIHKYLEQHSIFSFGTSKFEFSKKYKPIDLIEQLEDTKEQVRIQKSKHYSTQSDIKKSNNRKPNKKSSKTGSSSYTTDARLGKTALQNANFTCEYASLTKQTHPTFDTKAGKRYVEAHHLIPMSAQDTYLPDNIDRTENIVALCPICHRAVHYGNSFERYKILDVLFNNRKRLLQNAGINITLGDLLKHY